MCHLHESELNPWRLAKTVCQDAGCLIIVHLRGLCVPLCIHTCVESKLWGLMRRLVVMLVTGRSELRYCNDRWKSWEEQKGKERNKRFKKLDERQKKPPTLTSMENWTRVSCRHDSTSPPPSSFWPLPVVLVMNCQSRANNGSVRESSSLFFSIFLQFLSAFITKTLICLALVSALKHPPRSFVCLCPLHSASSHLSAFC